MRPLQDQILLLKSEVTQIQTIKSEISTLRTEVAEVCKAQEAVKAEFQNLRDLSAVIAALKEEIKQLREESPINRPPSQPSTPKSRSIQPPEAPT
jgi:outer membrane murein-binding lipoprotein Lpp